MPDDIDPPDWVLGGILEDPRQMYAEALSMASLAWWWWTHSLASVGGRVVLKPMLKHKLEDFVTFGKFLSVVI